MGNKLGKKRHVVDDKYTRPQGLYQHRDVDHKKLRKLILESKLAPCYPGDEDSICEFEECPICFLYYPSLNRSRCCTKSICTECFLQMKTPNSTRPTQCPFCKTTNYAVEYRGSKSKEEKGIEQIEEQRVIEAKIRMRQQELQDEEERMQKRLEIGSSARMMAPGEIGYSSSEVPSSSFPVESEEVVSSQESCTAIRQHPPTRQNRDAGFDLDLEDIMVMEAIWLSIQETGRQRTPSYSDAASSEYMTGDSYVSPSMAPPAESSSSPSPSPSGGLACAIAALAERQQTNGESSSSNMVPVGGSSMMCNRVEHDSENYPSIETSIDMSPNREWNLEHGGGGSEVAEAGTSYASSESYQNVAGPIVPESFEEQMMLAMAVSLAEARAMTSSAQGVGWN